jgi:hypothetical protein
MDFNEAANLLRSEDTPKQLHAIQQMLSYLQANKSIAPNEEFLNALIERGLSCEKSAYVRELSFHYISLLYSYQQIVHWSDIRAAIMTEIGTAENSSSFFAAIQILIKLPIHDLILFCGSKDAMSVIKSALFSPLIEISSLAIETFGHILLDLWIYLQNLSLPILDGNLNVSSTAEIRRYREDLLDFIFEILKNFSEGINGKALGLEAGQYLSDESRTTCAYFTVINELFQRYCLKYQRIQEWTAHILGSSLPISTSENVNSTSASLSLLMKSILPILLSHPSDLFTRAQELSFHSSALFCVSNILLSLLQSLPEGVGSMTIRSCSLVFEDKPALQFGSPEEIDETALSRIKPLDLSVICLAEVCLSSPRLSVLVHLSYLCHRSGSKRLSCVACHHQSVRK